MGEVKEKTCPICGKQLHSKQRTCSARCRKRLSRDRLTERLNEGQATDTSVTASKQEVKSSMNPNLLALHQAYSSSQYLGVCLEGSSRSGKTWAVIDFLVWLCSTHDNLVINIVRETFASFKTTLANDFNKRLPMFGLPAPFADKLNVTSFNLFTSRINFLGADDESKVLGLGSDVVWFNEALDISKNVWTQMVMRCRRLWIVDFNPSTTDHHLFALEDNPDVKFFHSTWRDNPYISHNERKIIEGYEPTPENIAAGTADDFLFLVYSKGLRASPSGSVFKYYEWVDSFPTNIDRVYYGGDVGQVAPSAVMRTAVEGKNLYAELLGYQPTESTRDYVEFLSTCIGKRDLTWVDSAAAGFIAAAQRAGYAVRAIKKFPGCRKYAAGLIKSYKLHLVKNRHYLNLKKEITSLKYRTVNGITLEDIGDNTPDHAIDSLFYIALANLR